VPTLKYYELKAYEGLAIQNFYLGQLRKAEYYQDRFLRGKIENDESVIKEGAIQYYKTHLTRKRIRYEGNSLNNKDDPSGHKFDRLGSPAGYICQRGNKSSKVDSRAIDLLPHLTEE